MVSQDAICLWRLAMFWLSLMSEVKGQGRSKKTEQTDHNIDRAYVILADITGTTILVPYSQVKSLKLNPLRTWWNIWVPDLQMSYRDGCQATYEVHKVCNSKDSTLWLCLLESNVTWNVQQWGKMSMYEHYPNECTCLFYLNNHNANIKYENILNVEVLLHSKEMQSIKP